MSKIYTWSVTLMLILAGFIARAQDVVSGTVKDETGLLVPGANVLIKGTTTGVTTDNNGVFSIKASPNDVLIISFIGYKSQEIPVGAQTNLDITLEVDLTTLNEVVIVGYGEQKRETLTGSISTVKGSEVMQSPATNVTNSLAGRIPGVLTITPSGEPGYDGSTIRIRGVNSLGNNDPLVVVDGIPGRSLERLDPSSIETITVLKDASAAIYGAQAANGVILITTKRGKTGKPEITLNLNQGYGRPTRVPKMANAAEFATLQNEIALYRGNPAPYTAEDIQKYNDGSSPWTHPNTDWFAETLKPWSGQNYGNVQLSGGTEGLRYFITAGAKNQDGYYKNSATKYSQYDFRSNLDAKISEAVKLGFDVAGRLEDRNFPVRSAGSIFRMVMRGKPNLPAYWPNGMPGPDIEYGDNPVVVSTEATGYDRDKWYILQTNFNLNINIPWVKGLSVTTNASLDKGFRFHKRLEKPWYLYSWDGTSYDANNEPILSKAKKGFDDARLSQDTEDNQNFLLNGRIDYEFDINDVHAVKVMVGSEKRTGRGDRFNAYRRFLLSENVDQLFAGGDLNQNNSGSAFQNARLNYFGRVNYNYAEKYLLEFVWRYDGSYIFPENSRFGFFPGVSAGWRVSEENFWKDNVSFIDELKIRGSYGQTGNDRINEFQYLATYTTQEPTNSFYPGGYAGPYTYIFGVNEEYKRMYENVIPNKNVTWEVATQSNIGFETRMLDNRLFLEADYFNYKRSNVLWRRNASVPISTGLSLPNENIGVIRNRGFDFNIGYENNSGDFNYTVAFNGGYQKNKILYWDEAPGAPEYQRSTGRPMPTNPNAPNNDLYYQAIGIYRDQAAVDASVHLPGARPGDIIFKDVNNDGFITDDDRVRNEKTNIPRFTAGLNLGVGYKGFDVAILFQGAFGAVRYLNTESGEIGNFLKDFYDNRWTAENPDASGPRTFNRSNEYWVARRNTYWLQRSDYTRLKNIQVGYSLPSAINERIGIEGLRVYVSGLNLFTISPDVKDFDPELGPSSGQGYPLQKVINAGLTLTF
jgi:TonB-dependent starch-binding outer membrane protein SusC